MYYFVGDWGPDDLSISEGCETEVGGGGMEEKAKEWAFMKSYYAWVSVYVPITAQEYVSTRNEWITRYIGDELWKIYNCCIAAFSTDYRQLRMTCVPRHDQGSVSIDPLEND